jgi:very-short-patch-repair endonuclease
MTNPQQQPMASRLIVEPWPIPKVTPGPASEHSNQAALKQKVEFWKNQLLDLSKRNKMINYRATKRATLKIIEPGFTELFNRLSSSDKELTFQRPIDRDSDLRTFSTLALLETLAYPIAVQVGEVKTEGTLLERRNALSNLRSKSKLARDEQGTNILYLCFGFIEWQEVHSAEAQWLKSPVLMMPVSLKLESIKAPFTLLRYDDDIEVNPTLDYLFNARYSIDLPTFELAGDESIDQYMQTIEEIADQHGWKLVREVSLGLLSFLKISMYHDLNNNYERLLKSPVIRAITGDPSAANNIVPQLTGFDFDRISPNDCYQVVNSDSSQQEAIVLSKAGVSFVMQGPPGTGKSQTITNIIAEALADGKTVLFVSEKAAALQVVYKRLTEAGLDAFCLALHSHKANKKEILDSIAANLKLPHNRLKDSAIFELAELFQDRLALNQYVAELHEEILPLEKSLYQAFGELSQRQNVPCIPFVIESPAAISAAAYNRLLYHVSSYAQALKLLGRKLSENPWQGTVVTAVTQQFKEDLAKSTAGLSDYLRRLDETLSEALSALGLKQSGSWADAQQTLALLKAIERAPLFPFNWSKPTERTALLDQAQRRQLEKKLYLEAAQKVLAYFKESIFSDRLPSWLEEVQQSAARLNSLGPQLQLSVNNALENAERLLSFFESAVQKLNTVISAFNSAVAIVPIPLSKSLPGVKLLSEILRFIASFSAIKPEWFASQGLTEAKSQASEAQTHIELLSRAKLQLASVWDPEAALNLALELKQTAVKTADELTAIEGAFDRLLELYPIGRNIGLTFDSAAWLSKKADDLLSCPKILRPWLKPSTGQKSQALLPQAKSHAAKLSDLEKWLDQNDWEERALEIDAEAMLYRFKTEYTSFFKIFKSSYRSDLKTLRSVSKKVGVKFSPADFTALLQAVVDIKAEKEWFSSNQGDLKECFGLLGPGQALDWAEISRALDYAQSVRELFSQGEVPEEIADLICDKERYASVLFEIEQLLPTLSENSLSLAKESFSALGSDLSADLPSTLRPQVKRISEVLDGLLVFLPAQPGVSQMELAALDRLVSLLTEAQKLGLPFGRLDLEKAVSLILTLSEEKSWLGQNEPQLAQTFGGFYGGEATDWPAIFKALWLAEQIRSAFGKDSVPETVSSIFSGQALRPKEIAEISGLMLELNDDQQKALNAELLKVLGPSAEQYGLEQLLSLLTELEGQTQRLMALISEATVQTVTEIPRANLFERISDANSVYQMRLAIEKSYADDQESFSSRLAGIDTDWDKVTADLHSVAELFTHNDSALMTETLIAAFCDNAEYRAKLSRVSADLKALLSQSQAGYFKFKSLFEENLNFDQTNLRVTADRVSECLNNIMLLDNWISCLETKKACDDLGLSDFTNKVELQDNAIEDVTGVFQRSFLMMWTDSVIGTKKMVEQFRRHNQDEKIKRFVNLDQKQLFIARERVRQNVINGIPDTNRVLLAGDELSILQKEIGKKSRIMPLRKLFKAIPNLLVKLKPCLMMSPLSVAYFLEAQSYEFDMVIFDEASQIFPQDAVGSIFRGRQVIIAGDSKQLPPTNFFATSTSNDDDDFDEEESESLETENYDSILEETTGVLPNRTLLWHYRSKHENLIAFSNQQIYQNELVTFPSSVSSGPDTGVEFVFVENGVYEGKGINTSEARRCVELVKRHIDTTPDRSLGIIAFSESQQKKITLELQKFREQHPEYESFFTEDREDEFFVKNIENVQGDERDTIIFSVSYAKTKEQRDHNRSMALRFGPLGLKGGERRLNVAITRAKRNIKLVSSIMPSDIDLSRTQSEGVRMLRQYIEFAASGLASLPIGQGGSQKDVFVDAVAEFLTGRGYKIKKYVGCSGYKIDLAVLHPHDDNCFAAGIETDGFSYASAKSARDRDNLRKSVLEAMGWHIYRVWSPEWIARPEIESEKLLAFVEAAINEPGQALSPAPAVTSPTTAQTLTEAITEAVKEDQPPEKTPIKEPDSNNPYGFSEYQKEASGDAGPGGQSKADNSGLAARLTNQQKAARIIKIVRLEQPIHIELLYQRMAETFGNQKATIVVRKGVDALIKDLKFRKTINKDPDGFLTLPGLKFEDIVVRIAPPGESPRQIGHISPDEIGRAMLIIAEKAIGLTSEGLIDAAAKALGYARKGEKMLTCLNRALERLIKEGRVKLVDDKVRIIEGDNLGR